MKGCVNHFTGSTEVGRILMRQSADTIKKVSLELGGNTPVVFDDADLEEAVEGAIASKYRNAGQTCVCANRILFRQVFMTILPLAKSCGDEGGDGFEEGVSQGPIIDQQGFEKIERHVADALAKGQLFRLAVHRRRAVHLSAYVLTGANRDMQIFSEETFGPVAALFKFDSEEEVIAAANDTIFGLAAYYFTKDVSRIFRLVKHWNMGWRSQSGAYSSSGAFWRGKGIGLGREGLNTGLMNFWRLNCW